MLAFDKHLGISLLISLIFHAVIFLPLPHLRNVPRKRTNSGLEVTYLVPKKPPPPKPKLAQKTAAPVQYKAPQKQTPAKAALVKAPQRQPATRKAVNIPKPESQYAKIEIPPDLPKEKESLYIDYYQSIREKIRGLVEKNYTRFIDYGEICLHFVLSADGRLKKIKVIDERSTNNPQLKEIVKRSVKEASPFFPFPQGLSSRELSFNVTVSFELEE